MRLISTNPGEPGVFAVGQLAVGVFAFGQMALGVVAVGQVARGVFALGQLAIGFVAFGQASLGVLWAGGMVAVGGRGIGLCLKVLPKVVVERFERPQLPPLNTLQDVLAEGRGWVLARIKDRGLHVDGAPLDFAMSPEADEQLERAAAQGHNHACLTLRREEQVVGQDVGYRQPVARERVLHVARLLSWEERSPLVRFEGPLTSAGGLLLRALGMCVLLVAWYVVAGADLFMSLL